MFKFVLSAFVCLAFAMPASAQCCDAAPACNAPQKRLGLVPVQRSLPQISLKCTTDCCGRSRRKLSVDRVCVTGAKLGMVDREPCKGGFLKGLFSGGGCGCGAPAPAEPCGCEIAPEPAPCGCDAAPVYEPIAAPTPVADCGCNG